MKVFKHLFAFCVTATLLVTTHSSIGQGTIAIDRGSIDALYDSPFKLGVDRIINTDLAVGRINGSAGVSGSGSATYQIPIDLPPGTANMVPSLSIVYDSHGGDGPMGLGWNITGLSAIQRTRKTIIEDGEVDHIRWTNSDALSLDGNRLRLLSGSPLSNGAIYGQEIEDFSKIYVNTVEGANCFQVWTKSGLVISYGCSPNSRQTEAGGATYSWLIDKVEDLAGNYYTYDYVDYSGEKVLNSIKYTGNDNSHAPYWQVVFEYANRQGDYNDQFEQGLSLKQRALLRRIIVKEVGTSVFAKKYFLQYAKVDDHSMLRQVTQVGRYGNTLNSTIIKYGVASPSYSVNQTLNDGQQSTAWLSGDFDGDGKTDLVNFYATPNNQTNFSQYNNCNIFLKNNSASGFLNHVNSPLAVTATIPHHTPITPFLAMDYNGDGMDDIMTAQIDSNVLLLNFYLYESPFIGGSLPQPTIISAPSSTLLASGTGWNLKNPIIPGDFNGDGRMDLITIQHKGGIDYGPFLTLSGTNIQFLEVDDFSIEQWQNFEIKPLDFNGDGRSDLMLTNSTGTIILSYREINGQWVAEELYNSGYPTIYHYVTHISDFNGDGKADLLTFNGSLWEVAYSKGNGLQTNTITNLPLIPFDDLRHIAVGDFNGDGLGDIVQITKDNATAPNSTIVFCKSTGENFKAITLTTNGFWTANNSTSLIGDYNGDGKVDILYRADHDASLPMQLFHIQPTGTDRLVAEISDGFAHSIRYNYQPLTNDILYQKGTALSYPFHKTQLPIQVVTYVSRPDGISPGTSPNQNTHFRYEGAIVHSKGRGFLGFQKITSWNDVQPTMFSNDTKALQADVAMLRSSLSEVTYGSNPGTNISSTHVNSSYVGISNQRWWLETETVLVKDHINAASGVTGYSYDSYGNVIHTIAFLGQNINGGGSAQHTSQTTNEYGTYNSLCNPGKILSATVQEDRQGEPSVSKTTQFGYQSNGWKLISKTEWPGMPKQVLTYYQQHNASGLSERTSVTASGAPTVTTENIFDNKGRFIVETVNPIGQSEHFTFDPMSGNTLTSSSVQQLNQSHSYDEFDRPVIDTDILGNSTYTSYSWDVLYGGGSNPTGAENVLYHTTVNAAGSGPVKTYYDSYDRKRKVTFKGFAGQDIHRVWTYDLFGALKTSTLPFEVPQDAVITTNEYTPVLHRLKKVFDNGPAGTTEYTYANVPGLVTEPRHNKVTIVTPAGTSSKTMDMTGAVTHSSDHGGSLEFQYDSWRNIRSVSDGSNILTTMAYDAYGRQSKLSEINAGNVDFEYNAYGMLTSQTHGPNNTRIRSYDALGRLLTDTGPEGTETYTYVSSGNGLNQLQSVQAFNGITKTYTYDSHHRLETETSMMGNPLTKTYHYDGMGRVVTESYSTGFEIEHAFNPYGFKDEVRYVDGNASVILAQATETNVLGQYTEIALGNGHMFDNEYNDYGLPIHYHCSNQAFDLSMDWDMLSGNLTSRASAISPGPNTLTESFIYDQQQLQKSQVSSASNTFPMLETNFSSNGNIDDKFDAGSAYSYGVYNATRVKNDQWTIPLDIQTVTYTSFNEPDQIEEGTDRIEFVYGPGRTRIQSRRFENNSNQISELRHYLPEMGYEVVQKGAVKYELHYVPLFGNTMAIVNNNNEQGGTPVFDLFYVYQDHLGSWLTVTNYSGTIVARQNFDAWGRRRDINSWTYGPSQSPEDWLIRGYTGHEHLDEFGIIHMNGRLYDPVVGRMFSPDNEVADPFYSRSYNRYSYAYNNPLKITDPSGEAIHILAGALIGGALNLGFMAYQGNIDSWQDGFVAFGIGAAAGAIGAATGGMAFAAAGGAAGGAGGVFAGALSGAVGSGFGAPIQSVGNALYFNEPYMTFKDYVISIAVGAVIGGAVNGIVAKANGNPVWKEPALKTKPPITTTGGKTPHVDFEYPEMLNGLNGNKNIVWDYKAGKWVYAQAAPKYWTQSVTFKGVRVYQRSDLINPRLIDKLGRTNLERMQKGLAPIGPDGESINLHHMIQSDAAGIAEVTQTFHQTNSSTIHINPNTMPSGINRATFAAWRKSYWIFRAADF